jgi:polysaccharide biosynthesis protein PslJ
MTAPARATEALPGGAGGSQPAWPTLALFAGYPVLWLLGVGPAAWIVLPGVAVLSLALRPRLLVPPGFLAWCGFLGWMLLSVVRLEDRSDLVPFALRAGFYLGATVVLLDIVNGGRRLTPARVHRALVVLFLGVVAGGLLGVALPGVSVRAPSALLLPVEVADHPFVVDLTTVSFAEVQTVRGTELARPSAPFAYTNAWGAAVALLAPFAVLAALRPVPGLPIGLVRAGVAAALVPVLLSLNRGLWFGLVLALVYAAVRLRPKGRAGLMAATALLGLLVAAVLVWTPIGGQALASLSIRYEDSDSTRSQLIDETVDAVGSSPFLGYGGPRASASAAVPLGTHGQLWTLLFSHGLPATVLYVGFMTYALWWSRNPRTPLGFASHVVLMVGLVQTLYYGQLPHQLFVIMAAIALSARDRADRGAPAIVAPGTPVTGPREAHPALATADRAG